LKGRGLGKLALQLALFPLLLLELLFEFELLLSKSLSVLLGLSNAVLEGSNLRRKKEQKSDKN